MKNRAAYMVGLNKMEIKTSNTAFFIFIYITAPLL